MQSDIDAIARIDAIPTMLDVVCRTTRMGFAAIARVTPDRWVICEVLDNIDFGLRRGGELKVETTICHEIHEQREPVVINHVAEDNIYAGHPTPAMYGFQSYISVPIILHDGSFFGTLCAVDPQPAKLKNPETIGMFKLFAELIAAHLDADRQLNSARLELQQERKLSELREQFIAVLGHDLRNPVAAVDAGAKMLMRSDIGPKERKIVALMQGSVLRMGGLIDNVLDLARARLGGGLALQIEEAADLQPVLEQVVAEFRAIHPDRPIHAEFALSRPVACDRQRIAQLFSNLLGNAMTHGDGDGPIRVRFSTADGRFLLAVSNPGEPIADGILANLFQPFFRGDVRPSQHGLGLGLYIASEIAAAHCGRVEVVSDHGETTFTLTMPCAVG